MVNMEILLKQISVEITKNRTMQLVSSEIDLDYAYGQMRISKATSGHCVLEITRGKFNGYVRFEKGFEESLISSRSSKKKLIAH